MDYIKFDLAAATSKHLVYAFIVTKFTIVTFIVTNTPSHRPHNHFCLFLRAGNLKGRQGTLGTQLHAGMEVHALTFNKSRGFAYSNYIFNRLL